MSMGTRRLKCLLVAVFSLFLGSFFDLNLALAQPVDSENKTEKKDFDANEVIFGHIMDGHEFHFFSYKGSDGEQHHASIPLPVIVYSPQKGLSSFISSRFHHGEKTYDGYALLTDEKIAELKLDPQKYFAGQIVAVNDKGEIDTSVESI